MLRCMYVLLVIIMATGNMGVLSADATAQDQYVHVNKIITPQSINEGEEVEVSLEVQGTSPIDYTKPNDIILVIDRSGSMLPSNNKGEDKMKNAKEAAKGFVDLLDTNLHHVGVVDFSTDTKVFDVSTDKSAVKQYIDGISANGGTGTGGAIQKARELLQNHRSDAQPVIILMTDGQATHPQPESNAYKYALEQASAAKGEGIVFYTIALLNIGEDPATSAPNSLMKDMATTSSHHHFVLGSVGLSEIYAAIVQEIGKATAYDVTITDYVSPEFEIVTGSYEHNIPRPQVTNNSISWNFNELKETKLTLSYKVRHKTASGTGVFPIGNQELQVSYLDYLGQARNFSKAQPSVTVGYREPILQSIEPAKGPVEGGNQAVIKGENFKPISTVTFGTTPVTGVRYVDANTLEITVPPGKQGEVDVTVSTAGLTSAPLKYAYYADPTIVSVTPNNGPLAGNNEVVIKGTNFMTGATVLIGSNAAIVNSIAPTQISVMAPAGIALGTVDVVVTNPDSTTTTASNAYTYVKGPEITKITPARGLTTGNEQVKITGDSFKEGLKVYFNKTLVAHTFVSSGEIDIITPAWVTASAVDVKIVNPDGQEAIVTNGYQYVLPAPVISSITPNQGIITGGASVVIAGDHFVSGAKVYFDNKEVTGATFYSAKEIRLRTPQWDSAVKVNVKVVNPDGQEALLSKGYEYLLPDSAVLESITPNSGPTAGGTAITITGQNFIQGTKLYFNSTELTVKSLQSNQITSVTPKWTTGEKVDVKIVDIYGREQILTAAFEYISPPPPPVPTITSVTPAEGALAGGYIVIIKGTNFDSAAKVTIGGKDAASLYYGPTEVRATVPASTVSGAVDVKIVNGTGEQAVLVNGFTYLAPPTVPAPTITSITPSEGLMTGGYTVSIKGTNFDSGAKVTFGSVAAETTYYGSTEVRAKVPASSTAGKVNVKLVNGNGQEVVVVDGFTYTAPAAAPAPTITSVTPNEGLLAGGYALIVKGTNFTANAKIYIGGVAVATTYYGADQLRGPVPAATTAGPVDVKVVNNDLQEAIAPAAFTYIAPAPVPGPVINEVTPNEGLLAGGYTIRVLGDHFTNQSVVSIGGVASATTYYSANELRVRVPVATVLGAVDVKVVNIDKQEHVLTGGFSYITPPPLPAPKIIEVTPASGSMKGNYYIFINGENFDSKSVAYIDGLTGITTFFSDKQLRLKVPASSKIGAVDVKVVNGDGQEVIAAGAFTYILPPPPVVTEITPNQGENSGGYYIILKGENFDTTSVAYVNGVSTQTVYYSATEIRSRVPASATLGAVDVRVLNGDGQDATVVGGFKYIAPPPAPAPTITSISPNSGALAGGYYIVIKGTNFTNTSKVFFDDVSATQLVFYSATELRARVPAVTTGKTVDVHVENVDGQRATVAAGFTYIAPPPPPAPTIDSIAPNNGAMSGGYLIIIKGLNYSATSKVYINGTLVQTIFYSASELRARIPASSTPGAVDVKVVNDTGQEVIVTGGFTYNP